VDRTVRVIFLILVAFVLSSLGIYKLRLDPSPRGAAGPRPGIEAEVRTAEGQILDVDDDSKTLTLDEGSQAVTFVFDERTNIVESDQLIQPSSIPSGKEATVKYIQKGGKNVAHKIEIARPIQIDTE